MDDPNTPAPHRWSDCEMCGRMVICGKCGNNCCNGGYGKVDGVECASGPSAYEMQDAGEPSDLRAGDLEAEAKDLRDAEAKMGW